jgi:hypothetical protein
VFLKLIGITFCSYLASKLFKKLSGVSGKLSSGSNRGTEMMSPAIFERAPELKEYYDWVTSGYVADIEEYFHWISVLEKYKSQFSFSDLALGLMTEVQLDKLSRYVHTFKGVGKLHTASYNTIGVSFDGFGELDITLLGGFNTADQERITATRDKVNALSVGEQVKVKFLASPLRDYRFGGGTGPTNGELL